MSTQPEESNQIRRGEIVIPDGYLYELTGGELCLDFANTLDSRPTDQPRELLSDYEDLVRWSAKAGAIPVDAVKTLSVEAARHARPAAAVLRRARALREAIFKVFSESARGRPAPTAALDVVNEFLPRGLERLRLVRYGSDYQWAWENQDALDSMLWPIVRSAAELLTSDKLDRVRVCSAEDCEWLFLDQSRNRSRRWCDMTVCGNRSKVRRFRQAKRDS